MRGAVEQDGVGVRRGVLIDDRRATCGSPTFWSPSAVMLCRVVERPQQQPRRGAVALAQVRREANARHRLLAPLSSITTPNVGAVISLNLIRSTAGYFMSRSQSMRTVRVALSTVCV